LLARRQRETSQTSGKVNAAAFSSGKSLKMQESVFVRVEEV